MTARRTRAAASPAVEPSELRERILAASVKLIEQEGLAKLSLREVARRAGVTHQAPYHYFADREAILGEIAEQGFRMLTASIEASVYDKRWTARQIPDRIVAMGRAYVEFACDHPAHFRIMFRPELVDLEKCPGAKAEGEKAFNILIRTVSDAVEAGLPVSASQQALATTLWSLVHGLACLILDGPLAIKMPDAQREEQIDGVSRTLRGMLKALLAT